MPRSGEKRKTTSFDDALEFFTNEHSSHKVRGNVMLSLSLAALENEATERGLGEDDILTLLGVACSLKFSETISMKLIKCLIPSGKVPEKAAINCISWMCTNSGSSNMQAMLVKWLILVYDSLDSTNKFHMLYTFIFYFLEDEVICPFACHLLYLITRKEDVKAFRIRALIQLQAKMGQQSYIQGLLSVYKLYCPHLVAVSIPASLQRRRNGFFKPIDRKWLAKMRAVQELRGGEVNLGAERLMLRAGAGGDGVGSELVKLPASKRRRVDVLPSITPAVSLDTNNQPFSSTLSVVPFAQINSFRQLLKNFDRLELPSQLAAALHNKHLQHVIMCYPDPAIPLRLSHWLDQVLNQEFFNQGASTAPEEDPRCEYLLRLLIQFSDFLQEGIPVCNYFLARYLTVWNGQLYSPLLLKLLTRYRLTSFSVLNEEILEPLRKLYFCSSVYFKCQILRCFTLLLDNFASVEYPRHVYTKQLQVSHSENTFLQGDGDTQSHNCFSVFSEDFENFDALSTIRQFIEFVSSISSMGLQMEQENTVLMHYVLDFFDVASRLYSTHEVPVLVIAGPGVIYRAMFCNNPSVLSRLADLINNYREDCQKLKEELGKDQHEDTMAQINSVKQTIKLLNAYILDLSMTMWQNKAFHVPVSKGKKEPLPSIYQQFGDGGKSLLSRHRASFNLHQHPAQLGLVRQFIAETQPSGSRPHPRFMKNSKDVFMEFMCRENIPGIVNFVRNNINRR